MLKGKRLLSIILLSFIILLSSCGSNMSGTIYFVDGMTPEDYVQIEGKKLNDLTEEGHSLYALNYAH